MNVRILIVLSLLLLLGYSCKDSSDALPDEGSTNSLYATFEDGSGFFNPEFPSPYGDTIRFVFPTHYPMESNIPINITKMRLKTYSPVVAILPNGSTDGIIDLTQKTTITLRASDGSERQHVVVGEIRKSAVASIISFNLPVANQPGFVIESQKIVGLVPGGMDLSGQSAEITLTPHATISPDPAVAQNFNGPVTYTVTAEDGVTKSIYTVKPITPDKLASGLRKGSGRLLWFKTLQNMGITGTAMDHMSIALASSGNYLMINTRSIANKYYNRFTGAYAGDMTMGGLVPASLTNFASANDDAGNILVTNLVTAVNQTLEVYKWKSATDASPVKYISWLMDVAGGQAGRKLSIKGNLDGDALIFMGASNADNTILRWQVIGGVLQSQTPTKLKYTGTKKWTLYGDIISAGTSPADNVYLSGYVSDMVCTNLTAQTIIGQVDLTASGYATNHSIDLATFNKKPYMTAINIITLRNTGMAYLYDVSNPALLSTAPSAPNYSDVCVYKSAEMASSTVANSNSTGDIILKVSDDGYKMILYLLVTNAGVAAYEFDCVDLNSLK